MVGINGEDVVVIVFLLPRSPVYQIFNLRNVSTPERYGNDDSMYGAPTTIPSSSSEQSSQNILQGDLDPMVDELRC